MSSSLSTSLLSHRPPQKHHPPLPGPPKKPDLQTIFIAALSPTRNNPNYNMQEVISKLPRIERFAESGFRGIEIRTVASYFDPQCSLFDRRIGDLYWDPMMLLEKCPEEVRNLKPGPYFVKMD